MSTFTHDSADATEDSEAIEPTDTGGPGKLTLA